MVTSLKQHIEYFNFRCIIQLDLPVSRDNADDTAVLPPPPPEEEEEDSSAADAAAATADTFALSSDTDEIVVREAESM